MKRKVGWVLLIIIWVGVALRFAYPADLHGGYNGVLGITLQIVDWVLVMPAWFILTFFIAPDRAPWAYMVGSTLYILGLTTLIVIFLIRSNPNEPRP